MDRMFTPEHIHAAVNHLPLVGLAAACIPLLYGLIRRQAEVLVVGFLMCLLFGGSMALVMQTGEASEHRVEKRTYAPPLDAEGRAWLKTHEERAEVAAVPAYVVAALGLVGLALGRWRPALAPYCAGLALVVAIVAMGLMAWTADSGGQIRHPEFRSAGVAPSARPGD